MTIPAAQPATELLISALTGGDQRIQFSFRQTVDRASRNSSGTRREELDALAGVLDGLEEATDAAMVLEPTLRHLLARVL